MKAELAIAVIGYMAEHPTATTTDVRRAVRGRDQDLLRAYKLAKLAGIGGSTPEASRAREPGSRCVAKCPACGAELRVALEESP